MLVAWKCKSSGVAIEDEVVKSKSTPRVHAVAYPILRAIGSMLTDPG
jgi:hypothetical protein